MSTYNLTLTLGYENTDFVRSIKFSDIDSVAAASVETAIQNYNTNLPAADKNIFIADDYDGTDGKLDKIVEAKLETITEKVIDLGGV